MRIQSWDMAGSAASRSDYSVCTSWHWCAKAERERQAGMYLRELWREQVEYPVLRAAVLQQAEAYTPEVILVENKASGTALLQDLRQSTSLPLVAMNPVLDKVTRLAQVLPWFESGRVFFPARAVWLGELEAELLAFPHGRHDDMVDSISQALGWVQRQQRVQQAGIRRL